MEPVSYSVTFDVGGAGAIVGAGAADEPLGLPDPQAATAETSDTATNTMP
nr:hypothetical protein MFLOJ_19080 [Mycobacterium florentinum]